MIWLVQLVFDCSDPDAVMRFWGRALEYRNDLAYADEAEIAAFRAANPQFDGRGRIDDRELRRPPVYSQRVPEPKAGRNRVRLEVAVPPGAGRRGLEQLTALGARPSGDEWADTEGNEFSLVEHPDVSDRRLRTVVVDALDPDRLLEFWSEATGYRVHDGRCDPVDVGLTFEAGQFRLGGRSYLHVTGMGADPGGGRLFDLTPGLAFVPTDVPKQHKNRLHLDLNSTDAESDRDRLVGLGATVLQWDSDQVLADPEGNEFCLSAAVSPS